MRLLLIFSTLLLTCELVPIDHLETTNAFLRNLLPWWPQEQVERSALENDTSLLINETMLLEMPVTPPSLFDLQKAPSSPLDVPEEATGERITPMESDNFLINFDDMAECPKDCSTGLRDALSIILQDMSHTERYNKICSKYHEAITCMKEDVRCVEEDRGMFEAMTSGFQYMCVEQALAFNATIKCIDDEASVVQSECDNQCQTKNLFMNWIMRSTMQNSIQKGVNDIVGAATGSNPNALAGWADALAQGGLMKQGVDQPPVDPQQGFESFRKFTDDLCRIGDCMLDCIRSKFNTRCEGSAGTLLSEVFVRPIAASQNKMTMLRPVLGMFMPEHCSYVVSSSELKKHRIDSTMDSELKRMYTEKYENELKERAAQDDLLSSLVPLDSNGVPIPGLSRKSNSPLDRTEKTLDEMILEMYSKNDNDNNNSTEDATENLIEQLMNSNDTVLYDIENSSFNDTEISRSASLIEEMPTNTTQLLKSIIGNEENDEDSKLEKSEESGALEEESSGTQKMAQIEGSANINELKSSEEFSEQSSVIESSGESSGSGKEEVEASGNITEMEDLEETSGQSSELNTNRVFEASGESSGSGQEEVSEVESSGDITEIEDLEETSGLNFRRVFEHSGDFSGFEIASGSEIESSSYINEEEYSGFEENSGQEIDASRYSMKSLRFEGEESSGIPVYSKQTNFESSGDIFRIEESSGTSSGSEGFSKIESEFEKLLQQL